MPETVVVSRSGGAPYSKGLMAQSLSALGLSLERAYELARHIEVRLDAASRERIEAGELSRLAEEVLRVEEGEAAVRRFRHWRRLDRLDRPLVVMLSGTAGVGKSTLATMLAHRLGLTRVIATDVIRQVLRAFLSREFMPVVHYSSFEAGAAVLEPTEDRDVAGFEQQAASVGTGVAAIVERACGEGTPLIVEGIHVIPGALEPALRRRCLAVEALLVVEDEERHRAHFGLRGGERPATRYLNRFAEIRKLQRYLVSRAEAEGVPVVDNATIDSALAEVMDLVLSRVGRVSSSAAR
jgi:2-phosphoglycerate kinase